MNAKNLYFTIVLVLSLSGLIPLQAQTVKVNPSEYPHGMTNPLMGFRDNPPVALKDYPYVSLIRNYIEYNVLDNTATDGVQKILNYTNERYLEYEKHNVKVIPRVILIWDEKKTHFPSDIPYSLNAWKSEELKLRVEDFIEKLGVAWNNDPRIAFVETGMIGKWGEQESPVGVDEAVVGAAKQTWAAIMGTAYNKAFTNKLVMVRNPEYWDEYVLAGVYFDSYGAWSKANGPDDDYPTIIKYNKPPYERYKVAPIQGEVAYSMSDSRQMGTTEDSTVQVEKYRNWFLDNIKATQSTTCGMEFEHERSANDYGASIIQKAFGYNLVINEFECSQRTEPGDTLNFTAKIINKGSAPIYEAWPLALVLVNETTKEIVYQCMLPGVDIRKWYPGSNYDWTPTAPPGFGTGTRKYLTPAVENTINRDVKIPADLPTGTYLAGLTILDPTTLKPGVFFAVKNFFQTSNTQPLCRIGIGANAGTHVIDSTSYDVFNWKNDTREYKLSYMVSHNYGATSGDSVTGVNISNCPSTGKMVNGNELVLQATVNPVSAGNKLITWSSSDPSVATVDLNGGLVLARKPGEVTIYVKTTAGDFTDSCEITVDTARVTGVTINNCQAGGKILIDSRFTLTATVSPYNAFNKSITWISSDPTIASVGSTTGLVTALKGGDVVITAKTNDGSLMATCSFYVDPNKVTGVSITNCPTSGKIKIGTKVKLIPEVSPANAFIKTVSWNSSSYAVASVDANGLLTAKKIGTTTITVRTTDGAFTATCLLEVDSVSSSISGIINEPATSVYPNPVTNTLYVNHPEGATINIFNIQGQLIYTETVSGIQTEIDIAELTTTNGLIFVHVASENNTSIMKVSVLK